MTYVNSPTLSTDDGIVRSPKEFSDALTLDLTDEEISQALAITLPIRKKWSARFRYKLSDPNAFTVDEAMKLVDQFEQELTYELATRAHLMVSVDVSGVFEGQPPVIEFIGALPSHPSAKYGLDHEKKEAEVKKAKETGQDFLGITKLDE